WPGAVSPAVLKVAVRAIRVALEDTATEPRFVETIGRSGYRFLAEPRIRLAPSAAPTLVVGREAALERLRRCFAAARKGHPQLVFVTGPAGIGKTAVVDRNFQPMYFVISSIRMNRSAVMHASKINRRDLTAQLYLADPERSRVALRNGAGLIRNAFI
ncbi:MAG TPA: AAA family ATPase, partial [Terriglobales bacterium]|nr:AAA family ATPase [Terriglobales bacterium]